MNNCYNDYRKLISYEITLERSRDYEKSSKNADMYDDAYNIIIIDVHSDCGTDGE